MDRAAAPLCLDPWAALVLSQIGPDESVLLLGSGLTAVDAILTLDRPDRTAPLVVVSRRCLFPQSHTRESNAPADCSKLLAGWLDDSKRLTARELVRTLRDRAASEGGDWRQVIDGLRPSIAKIWGCLDRIDSASGFCAMRGPFGKSIGIAWRLKSRKNSSGSAPRKSSTRQPERSSPPKRTRTGSTSRSVAAAVATPESCA